MTTIAINETTRDRLLAFKLRLSLRMKKEATYDDAVQFLLDFWDKQAGEKA